MGDDGMKGWEEDIGKDKAKPWIFTRQDSHHRQSLRQAKRWRAAKNELGLWDRGAGTEDAPR